MDLAQDRSFRSLKVFDEEDLDNQKRLNSED